MKLRRSHMHECGGALSLVIIVLGAIAEGFVANKLIAPGDAATTAHNIMAAPALWQFSVAGDLIIVLCAVPLLWIEQGDQCNHVPHVLALLKEVVIRGEPS